VLSETQPWNLFAYIPVVSLIRVRFVQFCMDAVLRSSVIECDYILM